MNIDDKRQPFAEYQAQSLQIAKELYYPETVLAKLRSAKTEDDILHIMMEARLSGYSTPTRPPAEHPIPAIKMLEEFWNSPEQSTTIRWRPDSQYIDLSSMCATIGSTAKRRGYSVIVKRKGMTAYLEKKN